MDESTPSKACTRCGVTKPLEDFHRRSDHPTGRVSHCKRCVSEKSAARYTATVTPERRAAGAERQRNRRQAMTDAERAELRRKNREHMKRAHDADPEKFRARSAAFKAANPERVAELRKAFHERHPERKAQYDRAYRESRRAEVEQRKADYYRLNAERVKARVRQWALANPERVSELRQRRRARVRGSAVGPIDVEALWTGLCGICGQQLDPSLRRPNLFSRSIDHIVPLAKGGTHTQDNLQWTHLVCNLRKGVKLPE